MSGTATTTTERPGSQAELQRQAAVARHVLRREIYPELKKWLAQEVAPLKAQVAALALENAELREHLAARPPRRPGCLDTDEMERLRAWIGANPRRLIRTTRRRTLERYVSVDGRRANRGTLEAAWDEMGLTDADLDAVLAGEVRT